MLRKESKANTRSGKTLTVNLMGTPVLQIRSCQGRIGELGDMSVETFQAEIQNKKRENTSKQSIEKLEEGLGKCNINMRLEYQKERE